MTILPITTAPDKELRTVSELVGQVDRDIQNLLDNMLETMYQAPGIGLSAIQVGVPKRIITVNVDEDRKESSSYFLINPEIINFSEQVSTYDEGCLSLPDQFAEIERPSSITVKFMDYHGKIQKLTADGLLSRCIQHEIDHLDGILFVDHLSAVRRNMIIRKLTKAKRKKSTLKV